MPSLKDTDPDFAEADLLMHRLWTRAVGTPEYNKREWQSLEAAILKLARRSAPSGCEEPK